MPKLSSRLQWQRAALKLQRTVRDMVGIGKPVYVGHRLEQYRRMWQAIADELNAELVVLGEGFWELKGQSKSIRLAHYLLPLDNPVTLEIAGYKPVVHRLLEGAGLPVPAFVDFDLSSLSRAQQFLAKHPLGCVVKPADGYAGQGVTTHVRRNKELERASILASVYGSSLLIEQQIPGECFRLLVFRGRMLHAVRRSGHRVTGDGVSSIEELMAHKLPEHARNTTDADLAFTLRSQALNLTSVLDKGKTVLLRSVGDDFKKGNELRTIYTETVTHIVHPSVKRDAERAAQTLGAELLGVDVITPDIQRDLRETGGCINELNTTPGLHHHYDSAREAYAEPALSIVRELLAG